MGKFMIENLIKSFSTKDKSNFFVLNGISFDWSEDESIAIMGESGSGKSTIAKLLVGLEKPSSGKIIFDNEDILRWSHIEWKSNRKKIQAVFQDTAGTLNNGLSVYKNLEEPLINLTKLNKNQRKEVIYELMNQTGISKELLTVKTKHLSGGEQRKLSLLRALAIKPRFLIMDEITSGLDFVTENEVFTLLNEYHKKYNISYLLITHDKEAAKKIANKIYYIENGKFSKIGIKEGEQ